MELKNKLDVVLKLAERCNLACPYCYYFYKANDLHKDSDALIKESTIRQLAKFLRQGVLDLKIQHLFIGLHGGEPLLLPKKRFDAFIQIFKDELAEITHLNFAVQSNGTLIDDEWIDLFEKHKIVVGVSIDGTKEIHDASRPDHKGRGSYDDTVRGLKLAQKAANAGRIPPTGGLCVANPDHDAVEIVHHFVEELGMRSFNLLLPREAWDSDIWKPQKKWIDYFTKVINYCQDFTKRTGKSVCVQILSDIMKGMLTEDSAQGLDSMHSNRHAVITVTGDGKLGPDDNVMALDKRLCTTDMDIFSHSLHDFFASDFWQEFIEAVDFVPEKCGSCDWYRTCRSGELFNRYKEGEGFKQHSVFCETIDAIHTQFAATIGRNDEGLAQLAKLLGTPPTSCARDFLRTNIPV